MTEGELQVRIKPIRKCNESELPSGFWMVITALRIVNDTQCLSNMLFPLLLSSPFLLHRDPARWVDPKAFQPQRWLQFQQQQQQQSGPPITTTSSSSNSSNAEARDSGDASSSGSSSSGEASSSRGSSSSGGGSYSFMSVLRGMGPNGAYVPFGGGPRNCIGTGFAMMEALLVLSALLQRYEVQPVNPGAAFPKPKALLTLRPEGVPLRVVQRQRKEQGHGAGQQRQQQQQELSSGPVERRGAGFASR